MTPDEQYLLLTTKLCADLENEYKARLYSDVVKPMVDAGLIRGPSGMENWYSFRSFDELLELLAERMGTDALFRIPTTCATWFNAEIDPSTSKPFRFFSGSAWLNLALGSGAKYIKVTIVHAVSPDIFNDLSVSINNTKLDLWKAEIDSYGRTVLFYVLNGSFASEDIGRFEISTTTVEIPALVFDGNDDWRRLSAAIFYPEVTSL